MDASFRMVIVQSSTQGPRYLVCALIPGTDVYGVHAWMDDLQEARRFVAEQERRVAAWRSAGLRP